MLGPVTCRCLKPSPSCQPKSNCFVANLISSLILDRFSLKARIDTALGRPPERDKVLQTVYVQKLITQLLEYGIHSFSLSSFSFSSASLPSSLSSSLGPKLPAPASTSCDLEASIISNDSREDDEDSVGEESSEG